MTCRQGCRFVKKKQLCIAPWCHDRSLAPFERQHAGNPASGDPATATELTPVVVQTATAITHQCPSGGDSVDLAKRIDTILTWQVHDSVSVIVYALCL
jgi:hypothetical protein